MVVVTEFQVTEAGARLLRRLAAGGLSYQATGHPPSGVESVAVASRRPIDTVREPLAGRDGHRVLEVQLGSLTLGAVYFPRGSATLAFWRDAFLALTSTRIARAYCFAGDWNTGRHQLDEEGATFSAAREFETLTEAGWTDAWRVLHPGGRQYTWVSNRGEGFRVDHALLSPSLAPRAARGGHLGGRAGPPDHGPCGARGGPRPRLRQSATRTSPRRAGEAPATGASRVPSR